MSGIDEPQGFDAVAAGTCTITFSFTENDVTVSADMALTVNAAPEGPVVPVSMNYQAAHTMVVGTTYNVGGGHINYSDNTGMGVAPTAGTFSTSDANIAYVDNFVIHAAAVGTCKITFSYTEGDVTVTGDMVVTVISE